MTSLPAHAGRGRGGQAVVQQPLVQGRVDLLVVGQRVGHDQAAASVPSACAGRHHGGDLGGRVDPPVDAVPGVAAGRSRGTRRCRSRARRRRGSPAAPACAGTSRIDFTPAQTTVIGGGGQREQVGRLVPGVAGVAVHAAEAAGREDVDAGQRGEVGGRGDGGGAMPAAGRHGRQVARAHLDDVVAAGDLLAARRRPARCAAVPSTRAIVAGTAPPPAYGLPRSRGRRAGCPAAAGRG